MTVWKTITSTNHTLRHVTSSHYAYSGPPTKKTSKALIFTFLCISRSFNYNLLMLQFATASRRQHQIGR